MALEFHDEVRSVERAADRVEVTFWGQAAFYWLPDGPLVQKLEDARLAKQTLHVSVDGATMEILGLH